MAYGWLTDTLILLPIGAAIALWLVAVAADRGRR